MPKEVQFVLFGTVLNLVGLSRTVIRTFPVSEKEGGCLYARPGTGLSDQISIPFFLVIVSSGSFILEELCPALWGQGEFCKWEDKEFEFIENSSLQY